MRWYRKAADDPYPTSPAQEGRDPLEMDKSFYEDEAKYFPRPHGYEVRKPTPIAVTAAGTLPFSQFISWLSSEHSYSDARDLSRKAWPKGDLWASAPEKMNPTYSFASYVVTNTSSKINPKAAYEKWNAHVYFNSGWDSSYHDAQWKGQCVLAAFGATPEESKALLDAVFSKMVPADDPVMQRFKMRALVRPGD